MRFIKDIFLGWLKGIIHFDPIILVCTAVLIAFIGFPDVFNSVLKDPTAVLKVVDDPMKKLLQQSVPRSELNPVIKYEEKQQDGNKRKEALLLQKAKSIPSNHYQANLDAYQKLSRLRPDNKHYQSKVNFYKQRVENERTSQITIQKADRAHRIKAERLAKEKNSRITAQKAKRVKALKEERRLALIKASKARVEEITDALKNSKWKADVIYHKNGKPYLIGSSIATSFNKKLDCKFTVSKSMVNATHQGNNTMYKLNTGAVLSNLFGSNSAKSTAKISSNGEVNIEVRGLDDQGGRTLNGIWVGRLQGSVLKLSLRAFSVDLKKLR